MVNKKYIFATIAAILTLASLIAGTIILNQTVSQKAVQNELLSRLQAEEGTYHPRRLVLQGLDEETVQKLSSQLQSTYRRSVDEQVFALTLPEDMTVVQAVEERALLPYLSYLSADYYAELCGEVFTSKEIPSAIELMADINLQNTWDVTTGQGITVAILDTGIDTDNSYFTGRISEMSYNAHEDKVVADYGWEIIEDTYGHGTNMASAIAATPNPNTGVCGVAPGAELLVIKADNGKTGKDYELTLSDLLFAMAYAIERDVDIICMSVAVSGPVNYFEKYTQLAVDSDIMIIAAAGNQGGSVLHWPAADENVIGVGCVDNGMLDLLKRNSSSATFGDFIDETSPYTISKISNYGDNSDLMAPTVVHSTGLKNAPNYLITGTSAACSLVAGASALYLSQNKYTEFPEFRQMLEISSADMGTPGEDWYYGYGMLDVHALVVEEKGTLTLDYLTDELTPKTQPFVRGHKLQTMDEPEREYVVFDGWYYDIHCTDEFDHLTDPLYDDITLYAGWANEDDTIPYTYTVLEDGTAELTGYRGKRRYITLPSEIDGYTVTSIGKEAFKGNSRLRGISFPETLKHIQESAFAGCDRLLSIELPKSLVTIGVNAFADNTRLAEVAIVSDAALKKVGNNAFASCGSLTRFDIPDHLEEITALAFANSPNMLEVTTTDSCRNYTIIDGALCRRSEGKTTLVYYPVARTGEFTVNTSISTIGLSAFSGSRLQYIHLHDGITTLEEDAFSGSALREITIPAGITEIASGCFASCEDLASVTMPNRIRKFGSGAFANCSSLETLQLPDALTTIGKEALSGCSALSQLTYSSNLKLEIVGESAFSGCCTLSDNSFLGETVQEIHASAFSFSGITSVHLPLSLTVLGEAAFRSCEQLAEVTFADGIVLYNRPIKVDPETGREDEGQEDYDADAKNRLAKFVFRSCYSLHAITIPESIQVLEQECLAESDFYSIHIPAGVREIKKAAMGGCMSLKEITVAEGNEVFYAKDGVLYHRDPENGDITLHTYPGGGATVFTVPDEVDYIGEHAFIADWDLEEITFPENLKVIREQAFRLNHKLKTINYAEGLVEIEHNAFGQCLSLPQQIFPQSLKTIGPYAFSGCISLEQVVFPKDLISIGYCAFSGDSSLADISFPEDATISRLGNSAFAGCTKVSTFTIPASVSTMGQEVFSGCTNLTEIIFAPNSRLTHLPAWVFQGADELKAITFGEGSALENIEARALEYLTKLESINLEDCHQLTNIDNYSFQFCKSLKSLQLPEKVDYIGRYAFFCCSSLSELVIPSTMDYIGRYAFTSTNNIRIFFTSPTLPAYLQENWDYGIGGYYLGTTGATTEGDWTYALLSNNTVCIIAYSGNETQLDLTTVAGYPVSAIGARAFADCTTLEQVTLPDTLLSLFDSAFANTTSLQEVVIPASVSFMGTAVFDGCGAEKITFAAGTKLTKISNYCFANTKNLQSMTIPATVQEIRPYAFHESALQSVIFPEDSQLTLIGRYAFAESGLTSLDLPALLTKADYYAFSGTSALKTVNFGTQTTLSLYGHAFYNSGLTEVYLPANVNYAGEFCFVNCAQLTAINVAEDHPYYTSHEGVLMSKDMTKLVCCPGGKTGAFSLPAEVKILTFGAFESSRLSQITIPKDSRLTTIGYRAFFNCDGISEIYIPSSVLSIDYYAFGYCTLLNTVTIAPDSQLSGFYEGAFYGCESLRSIVIPDSVKEISDYAFSGCVNLEEVTISENSQLIGIYREAFSHTNLASIYLPESMYEIEEHAFANSALTELTVPLSVKEIGPGILEGNTSLVSLTIPFFGEVRDDNASVSYLFNCDPQYIPSSLKTIHLTATNYVPDRAFEGCSHIEEVIFDMPVTSIGEFAFSSCANLRTYDFLSNVQSVGKNAFSNCGALSGELVLPNLRTIGDWAFYDTGISSLKLDHVATIGTDAFCQCNNLTDVEISGDNVIIGNDAFYACQNLSQLVLHDGVWSIGDAAFSLTGLQTLELPGSVKVIGKEAFYNSLLNVVLSEGVQQIGERAFGSSNSGSYGSRGYAIIPASVTHIGEAAFAFPCVFVSAADPAENWSETWVSAASHVYYGCGAPTTTTDGFTYISDKENHAILMAYSGTATELTINSLDGLPVYAIAPWSMANNSSVESVTTGSNVNFIHNLAFYQASGLKELVTSENLRHTGESAFAQCPELQRVTVYGDTGPSAFENCPKLSYVDLHNGSVGFLAFARNEAITELKLDDITSIGDAAFMVAGNLSSVTIPGTVKTIGADAFNYCGLSSIVLEEGIESIGDRALQRCSLVSVDIPDSVTHLGEYAFAWQPTLKSVSIGSGITTLAKGTFVDTGLTSVVLGDQILSLGERTFSECANLTSVTLGSQTVSIGDGAFSECTELPEIFVPATVTTIGASAFADSSHLFVLFEGAALPENMGENWNKGILGYALNSERTSLVDPATGLRYYTDGQSAWVCGYTGGESAVTIDAVGSGIPVIEILGDSFKGCSTMKSLRIGSSVQKIGPFAFANCTVLGEVTFDAGSSLSEIGESAFCTSGVTAIVLPEGLTRLGADAFNGCPALQSVSLPASLETFAPRAFADCAQLTQVSFAEGLRSIGERAFENCSSLEKALLPESLESIGTYAFCACGNLQEITTPAGTRHIGSGAFYGCEKITEKIEDLAYIGNWLIGKTYSSDNTHAVIREGTTVIAERAFTLAPLTTVQLPESLRFVDDYAFFLCNSLSTINWPASLEYIGERAFSDCQMLTSVILPEGLVSIGTEAFIGCSAVTELRVPSSVRYLEDMALAGMDNLINLSVPFIGRSPEDTEGLAAVLGSTTSLNTIEIRGCVDRIRGFSDLRGSQIETILFSGGFTDDVVICDRAFYGLSSLRHLNLPAFAVSIGEEAFAGCAGLESIAIPDGPTAIKTGTFRGCTALKEAVVPDSVHHIATDAFNGCSNMRSVLLPSSLESIGYGAFRACSSLEEVVVPNSVTALDYGIFDGCTSLKTLSLPFAGISKTDTGCWRLFTPPYSNYTSTVPESLKNIIITGDITDLSSTGMNMGAIGSAYLENVVLPSGVQTIETNSFCCTNLKHVNIPETVIHIGEGAFRGCTNLTHLTIPASVESIDEYAFDYCSIGTLTYLTDAFSPRNFAFNQTPVETLIIRYQGTLPVIPTKNLILLEGSTAIDEDSFAQLEGVSIYCHEMEDAVPWPAGWNNGNPVSYEGEWRYVQFLANETVIADALQRNTQVFHLPAKSLYAVAPCSTGYAPFVGWDIDADGKTDNLLAMSVVGEVFAHAIYSTVPESEVIRFSVSQSDISRQNGQAIIPAATEAENPKKCMIYLPDDVLAAQDGFSNTLVTNLGRLSFNEAAWSTLRHYTSGGLTIVLQQVSPSLVPSLPADSSIISVAFIVNDRHITFTSGNSEKASLVLSHAANPSSPVYRMSEDGGLIPVETTSANADTLTVTLSEPGLYVLPGATGICTEHRYDTHIDFPASCTKPGYTAHICSVCGSSYKDGFTELTHRFSDWRTILAPTCLSRGQAIRECLACGTAQSRILDPLGHDYTVYESNHDATCTEDGTKTSSCNRCGTQEVFVDEGSALGHTEAVDAAVAPTCTATGLTEGKHCTVCQEILVKQEVVDAAGHRYENGYCNVCSLPEGLIYEVSTMWQDDTIVPCVNLTGYTGNAEVLVVPDTIEGHPVYSVRDSAFKDCTTLRSVTLPEGIEEFGGGGIFENCTALEEIHLPSSLWKIGGSCFKNCTALASIHIPDSVTDIAPSAFEDCTRLKEVTIPASVTSIQYYAFSGCTALETVVFECHNPNMGASVFRNCQSLTTVILPDQQTYLQRYLFEGCTSLRNVDIPDSVTEILEGAFLNCSSLQSITIPANITKIERSFENCTGLKEIHFKGNAPVFTPHLFLNVTATAYYPCHNQTWETAELRYTSGEITWEKCHGESTNLFVVTPTCTEQGYTSGTCLVCGEDYRTDFVAATGHTEVVDMAVAPTCTDTGLTEGKHCSVCGEVLVEQQAIPALGHNYESGSCTVCGTADPNFCITVEAVGEINYSVSGSTVTVTHDIACKAGYLVDDAYVKIAAAPNPDGSYSFTAPEGVSKVLVVISGDVNGNGSIQAADKSRLNAALLKKTTLSAKEIFAADVNDDGQLLAADKSRLNAVLLKKTTLTW